MPPTFTGWRAMNIYTFDFDEIDSQEDFYREFARVFGIEKGKAGIPANMPIAGR
jgi:ribonuclease inhibitor